jgi:hypothetical protein
MNHGKEKITHFFLTSNVKPFHVTYRMMKAILIVYSVIARYMFSERTVAVNSNIFKMG